MPLVLKPVVTEAGRTAAINAANDGMELAITHIGVSDAAAFDPDGTETVLAGEIVRIPVGAGSRVSPTQVRVASVWQAETGVYDITAIGFYAGSTLFAVYSDTDVGAFVSKYPSADVVLYYDLSLVGLPANSITVVADSGQSAILSALADHLVDEDAHPQYLKEERYAFTQDYLWAGTASGTANAIALTLPAGQDIPTIKPGLTFRFKAALTNTAAVTVNVNGLGIKALKKNGAVAIEPNDIQAGAVYQITYDGTNFQISGTITGVGQARQSFEFVGAGPYLVDYTPGNIEVFLNGCLLPTSAFVATDGDSVSIPTAVAEDDVIILVYASFAVANAYTKAEADAKYATLVGVAAATAQATESVLGTAKVATQALVDAGVNDTDFVTAKKLRWGFASSFGTNGYVVLPTWLGGLIFQWGKALAMSVEDTRTITFGIAFTASVLYINANPIGNRAGGVSVGVVNPINLSTFQLDSDSAGGGISRDYFWFAFGL